MPASSPLFGDKRTALVPDEMEFAPQPAVHGDDGAVDVADQAVAEDDVRNFPIAARPRVRPGGDSGKLRRLASGLAPQRLVREMSQFRVALSDCCHRYSRGLPLLAKV